MFVIIGFVVSMLCIFGVFIAHGGNIGVVLKALPFEMTTILGAAMGAFLINNQMKVVKAAFKGMAGCFKGSRYTKERYLQLMALLYDLLQKARKEGLMAIEQDVDNPHESAVFQKYPTITADHHVVEFITDYLRMMVSGNLNAHEIESLMDSEIDTHHQEAHAPVAAIARLAGGLPAFGILLAYGVFEPLGGLMEQKVEESGKELLCVKTTLLASMQGYAPATAVEFGRKVLFSDVRPSFSELEGHVKGKKA